MPYSLCVCLSPLLTTFPLPARCCVGAFGCSVSSGAPSYGRPRLASLLPGLSRLFLCLSSPAFVPISRSYFLFCKPISLHTIRTLFPTSFPPDFLVLWAFPHRTLSSGSVPIPWGVYFVNLFRRALRSLQPPTRLVIYRFLSRISLFGASHSSSAGVSRLLRCYDLPEIPACLAASRPHSSLSLSRRFRLDWLFAFSLL